MSIREQFEASLGPDLTEALEKRGFESLTPVQEAVLDPELEGKDLRISSQTGSGKTVAIGFVIRHELAPPEADADAESVGANERGRDQRAHPRALVVTPTRELAKQVEEELAWLFAPRRVKVASVTGGGGYRDELRAFRAQPAIIVGTPGRLLDHLKRGAIDPAHTGAVVLDEADRMLDLGFREDLEAILGSIPAGHRTHLVSATFAREVRALADRVQSGAVPVEGTPLGTANQDIEHLVHLVEPRDRLGAIVNLLLERPNTQTLIFARTRAGVAELADVLADAGFSIAMLSGEMEQAERNRALAAFKRGNVDALVATDVAARGIDVQDVTRVLHAEPPDDADAYTHRSGRTGRAGRKGTSSVLVTRSELARVTSLLGRAKVRFRFAAVPTAESIREARDERAFAALTADFVEGETVDARSVALAERLLAGPEPTRAVARLVSLANRRAHAEPREVTPVQPPQQNGAPNGSREPRAGGRRDGASGAAGGYVPFRVSWGQSHGADPRRLVAMMCRRGRIEGRHVGAIRVGRTSSVVEVAASVANDFEHATKKPDPRDPRVHIRRWLDEVPSNPSRARPAAPPEERPSRAKPAAPPEERPSRAKAPPEERPSRAKAPPEERPSRAKPAATPADRPSRAKAPPDRPSASRGRDSSRPRPQGGNRPPKRRPKVYKR